ncbi:MAG: hypothetical protein A2Y97_13115 [Nitrospirae bacterium RBG_13_39_12]|nr:MAG: hypothetical protein A2Y97_13115 [Nitrospirae bacterium RBG_13_39_12]
MKVVDAHEMRVIDKETIEQYRIPSDVLMERAGLAVASKIKELYSQKRVIVFSGSGNNGGDGLVVARKLHNEGYNVKVFLASKPEDLKAAALLQYKAAINFGVSIKPAKEFLAKKSSFITQHSIIVDALFGIGLSKNIAGILSEIIRMINKSKKPVISVDIPSGISSDNGQVMGEAVRAEYTVTFGLPKRGHFLCPGAEYTGKLFIEDIGFPEKLLESEKLKVELLEKNDVAALIPERHKYSHKGDYGHVLIVAGSRGKTGAAFMTARACLRTGAGLVTIGVPESLADVFQTRVTEEMTLVLPDKGNGTLTGKASSIILDFLKDKADLLAIGPGIGVSADTGKIMKTLLKDSTSPIVIDADGINSIKAEKDIFLKAKAPLILTPHPGEMSRLINKKSKISIHEIEKDRINTAISFAKQTGTHLVLKGVPTVIAGPDGKAFINPTGNPGMATGGTGDVLTGMISGFLSQTMDPLHASVLGVYMHGLAGDIASNEKGRHSMVATDIIDKIPAAFFCLKRDE